MDAELDDLDEDELAKLQERISRRLGKQKGTTKTKVATVDVSSAKTTGTKTVPAQRKSTGGSISSASSKKPAPSSMELEEIRQKLAELQSESSDNREEPTAVPTTAHTTGTKTKNLAGLKKKLYADNSTETNTSERPVSMESHRIAAMDDDEEEEETLKPTKKRSQPNSPRISTTGSTTNLSPTTAVDKRKSVESTTDSHLSVLRHAPSQIMASPVPSVTPSSEGDLEDPEDVPRASTMIKKPKSKDAGGSIRSKRRTLPTKLAAETVTTPEKPKSEAPEGFEPYKALVLYNYKAKHSDEVNIFRNDLVTVVWEKNKDWFKVKVGTTEGLAPANYLQKLQNGKSLDSF